MRQVSRADLYYQVGRKDWTAFALSGNQVLTNHNPVPVDPSGNPIRYLVRYAQGTHDTPADLRFMAILSRSAAAEDSTPRLRAYQLQVT